AWTRLTEKIRIVVAELDEEIVGVTCGAQHTVVMGGSEYLGNLGVHLRVSPLHQRAGIYPAMMQKFWESPPAPSEIAPVSYGYISRDNAAMQQAWRNQTFWSVPPIRGLLLCSDLVDAEIGRPASPSDGSRIVEILNTSHDGEEFYSPHSVESLTARFERAPDLYSWNSVLIGEGSMVGVWPANLKVIRETSGTRSESMRALVLDHGFLPGYEQEFEELLRAWCSRLSDIGIDELSTFTSTPSPNYEVVSRLASHLEVFDLSTMNLPEPEGVSERGVYVDQIYF
ncbi:MAG: hypothetical protein ACRD1T_11255, partial [Acidimicrobiia bacterium]